MRAPNRSRRIPATRAARSLSTLVLSSLVLLSGLVSLQALQGTADASNHTDRPAFDFSRTRDAVIRVDTSTGAVWFAYTRDEGNWIQLGSPPDPAGKPNRAGRWAIANIGARSNVTVVGPKAKQEVYLALMDHATGRVFLAKIEAGQQWQMIAEPQ